DLAAMLQYLPEDDPDRPDFISMVQGMAARLVELQQPAGFWASSLLAVGGYDSDAPETSGTALHAFGIAKLIRLGLLDRSAYLPAVMRAWNAMVATAVQDD